MGKAKETTGQADATEGVVIDRATRIEALKLRAAELPWDPDHLRLMLVELLGLL